jgi:tetratricopeptide (TPR) repeat protein
MKRWMWGALVVAVVAAIGVTLVALPKGQEWTTDSPEALEAFQAGVDARMKLYYADGNRHIERAVELDPDFVIANLFSLNQVPRENEEERAARWEVVATADVSKLSPRERFYVERARAFREDRPEDARALLDEYVERYPKDPHVLNERANMAFASGDFETAVPLYERLKEISPNWVIAYNQLGYIKMGEGRFTEAEELFKSYRFIAPDQANPYDSLGELFIALGRYDEAEETFEKAIQTKPDFWASYQHLVLMYAFDGEVDRARAVIERMKKAEAPEMWVEPMVCLEKFTRMRNEGAWQEILDVAEESECVKKMNEGFSFVTAHYAASRLGDWERAMEMELEAADLLSKYASSGDKKVDTMRGTYLHMQGVRLALQGRYDEALEKLQGADESITYVEAPSAVYKLFNRMVIAETMLAAGRDAEAHALLTKVRSVNPVMVAEFEDAGLRVLGLDRG